VNATRRRLLRAAGAWFTCSLIPLPASATPEALQGALRREFGKSPITPGRITLDLPALAENGNSVRVTVTAQSPMTETDHVATIHLFAEHNPLPDIARFTLGPLSGRARVETRIRVAAEQTILAIARTNDGSLWSGSAHIVVTEAACLEALY
jgi:sulfur-oxidizing protein SoxY